MKHLRHRPTPTRLYGSVARLSVKFITICTSLVRALAPVLDSTRNGWLAAGLVFVPLMAQPCFLFIDTQLNEEVPPASRDLNLEAAGLRDLYRPIQPVYVANGR